jgi:BlaI family penicillinase repressor
MREGEDLMNSQISDAELEVMKFLWACETATSPQIVTSLLNRTKWKPKTIHTLISRLVTKGAIFADKSNPKMFLYRAAVSQAQYRLTENQSFLSRVYDGSMKMMLTAFIKEQILTDEERADLRALIERDDKS